MNNEMKICFYNPCNIGDTYCMSSIVAVICKHNPEVNFQYSITCGDTFFSHIPNISNINSNSKCNNNFINGMPPENFLEKDNIRDYLKNSIFPGRPLNMHSIANYNNQKYLFINTWCYAVGHLDYDIPQLLIKWKERIIEINDKYSLKLNYEIDKDTFLHPIKFSVPEKLLTIKNENENKKITFLYNYKSRSVPFNENYVRLMLLRMLNNIDNKIIIIPLYDSKFPVHKNILYLDRDFDIQPDPKCDNLLKTWEIAKKCDNIIITTCGSCWLFFDKDIETIPNILYLHSNDNHTKTYEKRLNDSINSFTKISKRKIKSIHTNILL